MLVNFGRKDRPDNGADEGDIGFDFESALPPEEPETPAEPQAAPDVVTIPRQEWDTVKTKLDEGEQWRQGLVNVVTGQQDSNRPLTRDEKLNLMVTNPDEYESYLATKIRQELQQDIQRTSSETIVDDYRAKYPEFSKYEPYVQAELQLLGREHAAQGIREPLTVALKTAVERLEQKMGVSITGSKQNRAQQRAGFQMDVSAQNVNTKQKSVVDRINSMTSDQFAEYRRNLNKNAY